MRGVDMTREVLEGIDEQADRLRALGPVNEALGRLDDRCAKALRRSGVMHMLQPEEFGGIETHPADFADAVYEIARLDGSAGWVAGSVGVPPWLVAAADRRARDEMWEADPDCWITSAYAPAGVMLPVDGGYRLSGEWRFVAGVDHCRCVVVGARVVDTGPMAGQMYALVPTADLRIHEDSWDAVGLAGTGSKTIAADDIFVPAHRMLHHRGVADGTAAEDEQVAHGLPPDCPSGRGAGPGSVPANTRRGTCAGGRRPHLEGRWSRGSAVHGDGVADRESWSREGPVGQRIRSARNCSRGSAYVA